MATPQQLYRETAGASMAQRPRLGSGLPTMRQVRVLSCRAVHNMRASCTMCVSDGLDNSYRNPPRPPLTSCICLFATSAATAALNLNLCHCLPTAGKYVMLYDGQGTILVDGDAAVTWSAPNRIGLVISPANGFAVRIVDTNITNPVRNISIVPAAKELTFTTSDIYQAGFLKLINGGEGTAVGHKRVCVGVLRGGVKCLGCWHAAPSVLVC